MKHVINKLTFEIACSDEQQAFDLREAFYNKYYNEFVDIMEHSCNQFFDQEQMIRLEKLEIYLSAIDHRFADRQQYTEVFRKAFEQALKTKVSDPSVKKTITQSHLDSLKWFLTEGTLPWWINERDVDLGKWCMELQLDDSGSDFISWLLLHQHEEQIWKRIAFQLASTFKSFIIASIPELEAAEINLKDQLALLLQQKKPLSALQAIGVNEMNDFVILAAASILNATPSFSEGLLFQKFLADQPLLKEQEDLPAEILPTILNEAAVLTDRNKNVEEDYQILNQPDAVFGDLEAYSDESTITKLRTEKAGVILIAAFLPVFFDRLGIWHEGKWVAEQAANNAVLLLHYLATGKEAPFEYELSLEKIICGLPLNSPVNSRLPLLTSEKKEADVLLQSVIEHWFALKDTSVSGLRQAFLQRDGLLSRKNGDWLLEVENKSMDVLMEQLPWGYATVRLPWNQYLICTEW